MSSEVRSWRGIDGKFAAQASFGGLFQNTKVKLIKPHGGIVAIPLDRLCTEDQNYVRQTAQISTTSSKVDSEKKPRSQTLPQPQSQPPPQPEKNSHGHTRQPDKNTILAYARLDNKSLPGLASFLRETATSNSPVSLQNKTVAPPPISFSPASDVTLIAAVDRLAVSPPSKQVPKPPAKPTSRKSSITSKTGSGEYRSYAPVANPLFKKKINVKETSFEALPLPILTRICEHLDVRSIIYLMARVSKNLITLLDTPQARAFGVISFLPHYQYLIDHRFVLALASYLKRHNLLHTVHTIIYDSTKIQELTVMYSFEHFIGLRHISLQKCWDVHSYPLANLLARRNAARGQERIRIPHLRSVEFGSMLRRGDVPGAFLVVRSETYGQDIGLIGLALRGLAGHDIRFDTYLCGTCDRGYAKPMFDCSFCGPVALKKCSSCAPQCER
jgi:SLA1 homology domain 1, SHD1